MTASLATSHFLFINNGQGQFTDETAARGAQGVLAQPYPGYDPVTLAGVAGVTAGDVNRDGWVPGLCSLLVAGNLLPCGTDASFANALTVPHCVYCPVSTVLLRLHAPNVFP